MKKFILLILICIIAPCINAQWLITPDGVLVDSLTSKPYMVIEENGTQKELYDMVLKNVHATFVSPDDVVSTIDGEMISVLGNAQTFTKYAGVRFTIKPKIAVKIEFREGRMRISASWTGVWTNPGDGGLTDPPTYLTYGGLRCFNGKGKINNEKRYRLYSEVSSAFISRLITPPATDSDDW